MLTSNWCMYILLICCTYYACTPYTLVQCDFCINGINFCSCTYLTNTYILYIIFYLVLKEQKQTLQLLGSCGNESSKLPENKVLSPVQETKGSSPVQSGRLPITMQRAADERGKLQNNMVRKSAILCVIHVHFSPSLTQ